MASLTAEPAEIGIAPRETVRFWSLLNRLEHTTLGRRDADGTIRIARSDTAGCVLYGPYYHFEMGRYRLAVHARAGAPALSGQPVLGVEIIILSRFQRAWRDFTAAELERGSGTLVFDVPPELSIDGGNEARFEFRVFHLGNADISIGGVELERLPDDAGEADPRAWRLLGRLRSTWLARRQRSGSVTVARGRPAGCLIYGGWPYLRLGRGHYRLTVRGRAGTPRLPAQPVLGVEILGRSRWYSDSPWYEWRRLPKPGGTREGWGDFRADEWAGGAVSLDFTVPIPMALEAGADAPFDIRLLHLGNAALTIDAVDLTWLGEEGDVPSSQPWRLLGRMRKARIGTETPSGVSVSANEVPGMLLSRVKPALRLAAGHYRLSIEGTAAVETAPSLRVDVTERGGSGWPSTPLFHQNLTAGGVAEFDVPSPDDPEAGDRRYDLSISHLGRADATITGVELRRDPASDRRAPGYLGGRKKLVLIGNCQCSVLVQAFNQADSLSRNYLTKYHFVQLKPNLYEFARRDIEDCDVLLVQDIDLWNQFPLRDCVRPGADIIKFPLVRFASYWPFDAWNGPGDREAFLAEAPNQTFPFLDGLLARLRHQIPDKEARFAAYRALEGIGVVNYTRIHALEERRLLKLDQQYDCRIGEFTLENFRTRQVFHTTVRPNWQGFNLLIRTILKAVGERDPIDPLSSSADALLRIPQVPIHPKVAADLGVKWADDNTRYQAFGQEMTWETYIRRYIEHYG
ncbi:MAG TPA: WcbI family polysaccharide biosynthesis putative acetyltransferase [Stellaceae bacterium]|jgi:hypothetical protein